MGGPEPSWVGFAAGSAGADRLSGATDDFGLAGGAWAAWQEEDLAAGTDLGGVVILRLLAHGGMGAVYEARQVATARTVAVKVVREGVLGPEALRRFDAEARVLARLRHPHIAQIHACGAFRGPRGTLPFIVMELVDGARSITGHAAAESLSTRERVTLCRDVASAVAHGHRRGVIHRDLKPGNILVDATGVAKVIDFGVARTLDQEATGASAATAAGHLVGTPRYMSPEQLGGDPRGIDVRTDVYALGLVLHELVVGTLPGEGRGRSAAPAAQVPDRRRAAALAAVEDAVRAEGRLPAAAARSLAAIVATCLEPRADDRYDTAGDLEAELERWLAGEPVRARPPTAAESLARLAGRHRTAVAAAGISVVSLLLAVVGIGIFALRAEHTRGLAVAARAAADAHRIDAERQADAARRQLYFSTVLLAAEARDRDNVAEAARLLEEAATLAAGTGAGRPLELDCLAASLDESIGTDAGHGATVTAVGWSADGRRLATGDAAGVVRIRGHAADRQAVVLESHTAAVWTAAFAPDGRRLATASADGTVSIHDAETGNEVQRLEPHRGPVYAAAFAADGSLLATAGRDGTARIWETAGWRERLVLAGHSGTVYAAAFSPDGRRLATGDQAGTVRLWDVERGATLSEITGHAGRIFRIEFAADGGRLATASEDGTSRVWNVADGTELAVMRHPFRVNAAAFVGDGSRVATASADGVLRVWDAATAAEVCRLRGHAAAIWSLAVVPGTTRAASGSADRTAREWDLDGCGASAVRRSGRVSAAAFAPDGRALAVSAADGEVALLDAATLLPTDRLAGAVGRVNAVAFTPDGRRVAAGCDDGGVRLWSRSSPGDPQTVPCHTRRVYSVAFSADGRLLATAAEDRTAKIHDLAAEGAECRRLPHRDRVFCAAFAPDGRLLATACADGTARLWRVASGTEERRLEGHGRAVNWLAFDPAGTRLATASSDRTVRLWNVADGRPLAVLTGPARQIWKVAFTADGSRVAAVSADGTAQLWDTASGRSAATLRGHGDEVWALAIPPDGRSLVTGSWDGTVRTWGVSAAQIAGRRLPGAR